MFYLRRNALRDSEAFILLLLYVCLSSMTCSVVKNVEGVGGGCTGRKGW
jgi:hypothetical protein